jgi:hypothetical protein
MNLWIKELRLKTIIKAKGISCMAYAILDNRFQYYLKIVVKRILEFLF